MYNRYVRNDRGQYTRVPEEEPDLHNRPAAAEPQVQPPPEEPPQQKERPSDGPSRPHDARQDPPCENNGDGLTHLLRRILDRLHLENVDTGDLILLLLLFLLFQEDADEELLIALGLLLIL